MTILPQSLENTNKGDDKHLGETTTTKKKRAPSLLKVIARIRYRSVHVIIAFVRLSLLVVATDKAVVGKDKRAVEYLRAPRMSWHSTNTVVSSWCVCCSLCCMG